MKIYLIDDNEIDLIVGRKLLEKSNNHFNISVCQNPVLALEEILSASIRPDAILLDWRMPVLNAQDWLSIYSKEKRETSIPIYILTSSIDLRDKMKAEEFEAVQGFFTKPIQQHHIDIILNHQDNSDHYLKKQA